MIFGPTLIAMSVSVQCQQAGALPFRLRFNSLDEAVRVVICYAENERACSISLGGMAAYDCVIMDGDSTGDPFVREPGKSSRETFIDILRARSITA